MREKIAGFPEYMEILLAPLILRVIRIAESLSASAETRGIALPGRRQSFTSLKVNRSDGVLTVLIAALIGLGIFLHENRRSILCLVRRDGRILDWF